MPSEQVLRRRPFWVRLLVRRAAREAAQKRCATFAALAPLFLALGVFWVLVEKPTLGWVKICGACLLAGGAAWTTLAIRWLDRHQGWQ
jgi:hypothetical protein